MHTITGLAYPIVQWRFAKRPLRTLILAAGIALTAGCSAIQDGRAERETILQDDYIGRNIANICQAPPRRTPAEQPYRVVQRTTSRAA